MTQASTKGVAINSPLIKGQKFINLNKQNKAFPHEEVSHITIICLFIQPKTQNQATNPNNQNIGVTKKQGTTTRIHQTVTKIQHNIRNPQVLSQQEIKTNE